MARGNEAADVLAERLRDDYFILDTVRKAVAEALEQHRCAGHRVVIWRDGQIVWLSPEEIGQAADADRDAQGNNAQVR